MRGENSKSTRDTLFFLLNDESPEKNLILGCVRCKSRSIWSAISVCYKQSIHHDKWWLKLSTRNSRHLRMEKSFTWKYWCQALLLPTLKGWSSWETPCRLSGPAPSPSAFSSSEFNTSLFTSLSSDCRDSRFRLVHGNGQSNNKNPPDWMCCKKWICN